MANLPESSSSNQPAGTGSPPFPHQPSAAASPPAEPAESSSDLPSLLSLFEQRPPPPPSPAPLPPAPPAPPPAAAARALAADTAARQQAEHLVAQLRQQPATALGPPPAPRAAAPLPPPAGPPAPPPPALALPHPAAPRSGNGLLLGLLAVALAVLAALSYVALRRPTPATPVASLPAAAAGTAPATATLPRAAAPAPVIVRETVRVVVPASLPARPAESRAPVASSPGDTTAAATAATAAPDSEPVPAAPEAGDEEATRSIRAALAAYYADLYEPPLHAADYFAPQVERLYSQRNLTPDQIDAELTRTFFPDNRHAAYQVEPGTLQVAEPAADGSRTATYVEAGRLYRVSRGQHQRLRTQVRVRFNAAGQIDFMRQEKLLGSEFEL